MINNKLPNEGFRKPGQFILDIEKLEKGDTINIAETCTFTFIDRKENLLHFEISDE
jgi:hypothetical protein